MAEIPTPGILENVGLAARAVGRASIADITTDAGIEAIRFSNEALGRARKIAAEAGISDDIADSVEERGRIIGQSSVIIDLFAAEGPMSDIYLPQ